MNRGANNSSTGNNCVGQFFEEHFCLRNIFSSRHGDDYSVKGDGEGNDSSYYVEDDEDDGTEIDPVKITGMEILYKKEQLKNSAKYQTRVNIFKRWRSEGIGNRKNKFQVTMLKNDTISSMHSSSVSTATVSTARKNSGLSRPLVIKTVTRGIKRR